MIPLPGSYFGYCFQKVYPTVIYSRLFRACVKGDHHGGACVREHRCSPRGIWKVGKRTQQARAQDTPVYNPALLFLLLP